MQAVKSHPSTLKDTLGSHLKCPEGSHLGGHNGVWSGTGAAVLLEELSPSCFHISPFWGEVTVLHVVLPLHHLPHAPTALFLEASAEPPHLGKRALYPQAVDEERS